MIRILHVLHSMNRGGAEAMLMNFYRNVNRENVQFDFLLTEQSRCQYEDEIERLGGRVFRVPLLTMGAPMPYINGVKEFLTAHPEYKVVHSHTSSKSAVPLWVAKKCGVPVRVCHAHSSSSGTGVEGVVRGLLGVWLKQVATDFMACGVGASRCWYGNRYTDSGRVMIVPNAVDTKKYAFDPRIRREVRGKLGIEDDDFVLGMVSRFHPVKNHLFMLDVIQMMKDEGKKVKLLLVGDGELRHEIEQKAKKLGIEHEVIMVGLVSDVHTYLHAMDAIMMPSLNEGLPVSLVEAQTNGLPCWVSTGVPEEVNITGNVTFLPLVSKSWAESLMRGKVSRDAAAVRKVREAHYDIELASKELERWYLAKFVS